MGFSFSVHFLNKTKTFSTDQGGVRREDSVVPVDSSCKMSSLYVKLLELKFRMVKAM